MEPRGVRKIPEAGFYDSKAPDVILLFRECSGNKKIEFFVLGCEDDGLLKRFESFFVFTVPRISLSK